MEGLTKESRIPLEDAAIHYLELATQSTWGSNICQECIIEDYSDLEDEVYYSMTRAVLGTERTLKLYKTKTSHRFQLHCELKNVQFNQNYDGKLRQDRMIFYIMYDREKPVWPGDLKEADYGYSIEVPNELLLHGDNKYLIDNNALVVQFNFRHYTYTRPPIARSGISTRDDEEALSKDLLSLYEKQGEDAEYSVTSREGTNFKIHKVICDARSQYLSHFLANFSKRVTLAFEKRILDMGLRYMYGGKLNDVSLDDLIELLGFATKCKLWTLRQALTIALREKLDKGTSRRIYEAAKTHDLSELVAYAEDFIPKGDPEEKQSVPETGAIPKATLRQTRRGRKLV